jgi:hypothetical protein
MTIGVVRSLITFEDFFRLPGVSPAPEAITPDVKLFLRSKL